MQWSFKPWEIYTQLPILVEQSIPRFLDWSLKHFENSSGDSSHLPNLKEGVLWIVGCFVCFCGRILISTYFIEKQCFSADYIIFCFVGSGQKLAEYSNLIGVKRWWLDVFVCESECAEVQKLAILYYFY